MVETIDNFSMCSQLNDHVKKSIRLFHVFDDNMEYNVLYITYDDKVFGFGSNYFGCCGLGHNQVVEEPEIIPQLCGRKIEQFIIGMKFILAVGNNLIYSWGGNAHGQLGRGFVCKNEFYGPVVIKFRFGTIKQVCCGTAHALCLNTDGKIYGWGENEYGSVGRDKCVLTIRKPVELNIPLESHIISIFCSFRRSFALTNDGLVYSWGYNRNCTLGHNLNNYDIICEPKMVLNLQNITSISHSTENTYFLNNKGLLFFTGKYIDEKGSESYQKLPKLLECHKKFFYTHSIAYNQRGESIATALSGENVYYLNWTHIQTLNNISLYVKRPLYLLLWERVIGYQHKNLFEFYNKNFHLAHKTLYSRGSILCENFLTEIQIDELTFKMKNLFETAFKIEDKIGSGGFGTVYKVKHIYTQKCFAIKKIETQYINLREVNNLAKCNFEFVVKYFNHWIEDDNCLYIQMELCWNNLAHIIEHKQEFFGRDKYDEMTSTEYFISSQLFIELLECVQYLHESKIMHRDLKPDNILVSKVANPYKRFLKLCDFGLAKLDSDKTMSHTNGLGTLRYMAPEIMKSTCVTAKYNRKVDIYSLGIILQDLFSCDINRKEALNLDQVLQEKWCFLFKAAIAMTTTVYSERPTCAQLMSDINRWTINNNELDQFGINNYSIDNKNINEIDFFHIFFENKLNQSRDENGTSLLSYYSMCDESFK